MTTRQIPTRIIILSFLLDSETRQRVVVDIHEEQTSDEARETCNNLGLRLLTINSEEKNTKVAELLQDVNEA